MKEQSEKERMESIINKIASPVKKKKKRYKNTNEIQMENVLTVV